MLNWLPVGRPPEIRKEVLQISEIQVLCPTDLFHIDLAWVRPLSSVHFLTLEFLLLHLPVQSSSNSSKFINWFKVHQTVQSSSNSSKFIKLCFCLCASACVLLLVCFYLCAFCASALLCFCSCASARALLLVRSCSCASAGLIPIRLLQRSLVQVRTPC